MARISEIELRDVRCFEGSQSARLGRITLLVGENGTGKSTFLGCYRALAKFANLDDLSEINHFAGEPFHMSSFDSLVRTGKTDFALGAKFDGHCHDAMSLAFRDEKGQPIDCRMELTYPGTGDSADTIELSRPDGPGISLHLKASGFEFELLPGEISFRSISTWLSRYVRHGYFPFGAELEVFREQAIGGAGGKRPEGFAGFAEWLRKSGRLFPPPSTFQTLAPEPALPPCLPRYESIPRFLQAEDRADLFEFLGKMGRKLGLWRRIWLRAALDGRGFEIMVETPDGPRNIVHAGVGVQKLLPILSEFHRSSENTVLLLQQPESHVHPQAQARLAQWMAESERSFIIETHSDHLVNRFRICAMNGDLDPDDLSIVYFEKIAGGMESRLHSISVDILGNVLGCPRGYRSFFLNESDRLLGFK